MTAIHNTWEPSPYTIHEIDHDYALHAFEVFKGAEHVGTIYPDTIEDADAIREALDRGESPKGWEDGLGGTIA